MTSIPVLKLRPGITFQIQLEKLTKHIKALIAQYAIWPSRDLAPEIMRLRRFATAHSALDPDIAAWKLMSVTDLGWKHSKLYHEDQASGRDDNLRNRTELLAMMRSLVVEKKLAKVMETELVRKLK